MIYHKYSWLLSAVIKIPYGSLSLHICRFQQLPHASHSEQSEYLPLSSARSVHPFPKQCSSARQDNSSVHNISGQFRRCLFQHSMDCFYDLSCRIFQCHTDFFGSQFYFFGSPVSTFRPFTSITCGFASSIAVPIFILIASAVSDPINKLCVFRI